jgi:hypothetical protein
MLYGVIIVYVAVLFKIFWTFVIFKFVEIIYDVSAGIVPVLSAVSESGIGITQLLHFFAQHLVLCCCESFGSVAKCVQPGYDIIYGRASDVGHSRSFLANLAPHLLVFG